MRPYTWILVLWKGRVWSGVARVISGGFREISAGMSVEVAFANFFKAEIQSSGRKLFEGEKVSISVGSDTLIEAFVRVSPVARVRLSSESVGSPRVVAECSCPVAQKSQFCKHVWATLLAAEVRCPDFVSEKREIEKPDPAALEARAAAAAAKNPASSARSTAAAERRAEFEAAAKVRAAGYRKQQYERQKARARALKGDRRGERESYSPEVESGLAYFKLNGFEMPHGPDEDVIREAKKVLSRVFHPDRGGTNAEVGELNHFCDVLLKAARGG